MSFGNIDGISLFLLGLLGTGHCLGMCGPLVVALPGAFGRWPAHLFYHAGRLASYVIIGTVLGAAGGWMVGFGVDAGRSALDRTIYIQAMISLIAALFLVWLGLIRLGLAHEPEWMAVLNPQKMPGYERVLRQTLNRRNALWLLAIGAMLGWLPCGLSYAAFAKSLASQQPSSGAWLAFLFGLGTLPGLLALGSGIGRLWRRYRVQTEMASGLLMIGMALHLLAKTWTALI